MFDSQQPTGPSPDADLIRMVRAGRTDAYGMLFERHMNAAYNQARQLSRDRSQADDLVAEAFMRVLDILRAGRGPDTGFRAYLLTTLRHTAYDTTRRDRKIKLSADIGSEIGVSTDAISVPFNDPAITKLERSLVATAFNKLPERWQVTLSYTVIHSMGPQHVAQMLDITPNGARALAYRARQALCVQYLQAHLSDSDVTVPCRATFSKLGARARDLASANTTPSVLSKRQRRQVDAHLRICHRCCAHVQELAALCPQDRSSDTHSRRPCTRRNPLPARTAQP